MDAITFFFILLYGTLSFIAFIFGAVAGDLAIKREKYKIPIIPMAFIIPTYYVGFFLAFLFKDYNE
jgi:hypothetical protein